MPAWEKIKAFMSGHRWLLFAYAIWGTYFSCIWTRVFFWENGHLHTRFINVWGDWALHLTYNRVFAERAITDWFTNHPLFVGSPWRYHFLINMISGLLIKCGMNDLSAAIFPSCALSLLLIFVLYRFFRDNLLSEAASFWAVNCYFTLGGLGWYFFFELWQKHGFAGWFYPIKKEGFPDQGIYLYNVIATQLLPQRPFLLGLVLGVALLTQVQRLFAGVPPARAPIRALILGAAGSILLFAQIYAFLIFALTISYIGLRHWRRWQTWLPLGLGFGIFALIGMILFLGSGSGDGPRFFEWYPGFYANPNEENPVNWFWFWIVNWGILLPLVGVALWRGFDRHNPFVWSGITLWIICNLFKIAPWIWDNTKFLSWASLLLLIPAMRLVFSLQLNTKVATRALRGAFILLLTAQGIFDTATLAIAYKQSFLMFRNYEFDLAEKFKEISAPTDVVLIDTDHLNWVAALTGRQVVMGFPGWLWSSGINYQNREEEIAAMYELNDAGQGALKKYGVRFVVIGPKERKNFKINDTVWNYSHSLVIDYAGIRIFEIRR